MNPTRPEADLNETIAKILRIGIILSASVIAAGLVLELLTPPSGAPATLQGTLAVNFGGPTLTASAWLTGIAAGNAVGILQLGTLILLATPIVRVGASVLLFLREKDKLYVGVTLLVLGMLLFAIVVLGPLEA